MKTLIVLVAAVLLMSASIAVSKDLTRESLTGENLGVVGKTYEIEETDLLAHIQMELEAMQRDGRLAEQQQLMRKRVKASVERPPGRALPRARESRVFHHDPSITTEEDLLDHAGNLIYPAGTTVNPLQYTSLTTPLVFFDADDSEQRSWVRELLGDAPDRYVVLLTRGPVIELMQQWQVRLYFDQHGRYTDQLGITALPAVVRQEGLTLRIDEVALEEGF